MHKKEDSERTRRTKSKEKKDEQKTQREKTTKKKKEGAKDERNLRRKNEAVKVEKNRNGEETCFKDSGLAVESECTTAAFHSQTVYSPRKRHEEPKEFRKRLRGGARGEVRDVELADGVHVGHGTADGLEALAAEAVAAQVQHLYTQSHVQGAATLRQNNKTPTGARRLRQGQGGVLPVEGAPPVGP